MIVRLTLQFRSVYWVATSNAFLFLIAMGDGYVECIDGNTLLAISNSQPEHARSIHPGPSQRAAGNNHEGRFSWKNQHTSLVSFRPTPYLNRWVSPAPSTERKPAMASRSKFDKVRIPRMTAKCAIFCEFMRHEAPRDAALAGTPDAIAAPTSSVQLAVTRATSHYRDCPGTVINGGKFTVPQALSSKRIHPFSVSCARHRNGDGIVRPERSQSTRNKLRTPALGVRARIVSMHDGAQ